MSIAKLKAAYPLLISFFDGVGSVQLPRPRQGNVQDAVVHIVIGQMLSGKAANAIRTRVMALCGEKGNAYLLLVSDQKLANCGLSRRKIRAIRDFSAAYQKDPQSFENWRNLPYEELVFLVKTHWGLSTWSAEMLAIFHFGNPDVFPTADGSIQKAKALVESRYMTTSLDPSLAAPYRTKLAMYFWASLDRGHWRR